MLTQVIACTPALEGRSNEERPLDRLLDLDGLSADLYLPS
jgi:hypothetical protein